MKLVSVRCDSCREVGGFGPSASAVRFDLRSRCGWKHHAAIDLCSDCLHTMKIDRDGALVRRLDVMPQDRALS